MKYFYLLFVFFYYPDKLQAQDTANNNAYLLDSFAVSLNNSAQNLRGEALYNFAFSQYKIQDSLCLIYSKKAFSHTSVSDSTKTHTAFLMARVYRRLGNYDSSAYMFNQTIALSTKYHLKKEEIQAYSNYGNLERSNGNIKQALFLLNKADSLANFVNDTNLKATIINNIGIVYITNKDFNKSKEFYHRLLSLKKIHPKFISAAYSNLSGIYTNLDKYDTAIVYSLKAIELKEEHAGKGLAQAYNNLGTAYIETKKYQQAEKYLNKALTEYEKGNLISGKVKVFNNLGQIFLAKGNLSKAENILLKAEKLNRKNVYQYSALHTQEYLFQVYEKKKNWEKAFSHLQAFNKLNENQVNLDKVAAIKDLQTKYETNKLSQEKKLAVSKSLLAEEKAKRSQNISLVALISLIIVTILILFILNRLRVIRDQKIKLDEAYQKLEVSTRNELAVSNLKALKSQMNPHFIFNLLNAIQALILKGNIDASYTYMSKFAKLVRQTLHFSDANLVELEEETNLLKLYLDLEQLRFSEDFEYQIIDHDIEGVEIPPLLIQPFIENALIHGLLHKKGKKTLKVEFELTDKLICTITDNGIGRLKSKIIKERQKSKHKSFSTQAIEKRFKILSETFQGNFGFEYNDVLKKDIFAGTKVTLVIPFKRIF